MPGLNFHKTESDYLEQSNLDKKVNFNIAQLGLSFYFGDGGIATQPIRGSSFAITVDRVNDFYNETYYQGKNYDNSYINAITENPNDDLAVEAPFNIRILGFEIFFTFTYQSGYINHARIIYKEPSQGV